MRTLCKRAPHLLGAWCRMCPCYRARLVRRPVRTQCASGPQAFLYRKHAPRVSVHARDGGAFCAFGRCVTAGSADFSQTTLHACRAPCSLEIHKRGARGCLVPPRAFVGFSTVPKAYKKRPACLVWQTGRVNIEKVCSWIFQDSPAAENESRGHAIAKQPRNAREGLSTFTRDSPCFNGRGEAGKQAGYLLPRRALS